MNFFKNNFFVLLLVFLTFLLEYFSSFTQSFLRYERQSILDGELWRLISAHFVHGSWEHFFMNIFALIILWSLFKNLFSVLEWFLLTFVSALGISLLFVVFMEHLSWYVGFSGVLHSIVVFGSIVEISKGKKEFFVLLIFVIVKILMEQFYGSYLDRVLADESVVVNAHLFGVIVGACIGVILLRSGRYKTK